MTKEEAVKRIKTLRLKIDKPTDISLGRLESWIHKGDVEALDMAIKALEQQPSDDCVSREQALKKLKESAKHHAKWIENDKGAIVCSCCNTWFPKERKEFMWKCPYCFAEMRGSENG